MKPWYESKTVWLNALTIAAAVLAFILDTQAAGGLPFELDARWVVLVLGLVNLLLRFVTDRPVK